MGQFREQIPIERALVRGLYHLTIRGGLPTIGNTLKSYSLYGRKIS